MLAYISLFSKTSNVFHLNYLSFCSLLIFLLTISVQGKSQSPVTCGVSSPHPGDIKDFLDDLAASGTVAGGQI